MNELGLKRYYQEFTLGGDDSGISLGAGTKVCILDIRQEPWNDNSPGRREGDLPVRVVAVVELSAEVVLMPNYTHCHTCGVVPGLPDNDGLWYVLQNHDGKRLLFPRAEDVSYEEPERDSYPAIGWEMIDGKMNCGACVSAIRESIETLKTKRRKK